MNTAVAVDNLGGSKLDAMSMTDHCNLGGVRTYAPTSAT